MKIAILSDIHANQYALEAVLQDAERQAVDRFWFLGDAVGYGPHPVEPLLWLKEQVALENWVLGNHDAMLARLLTPQEWEVVNHTPRKALALNRETLTKHPEADTFWQAAFTPAQKMPKHHTIDDMDYLLVHSCPEDPLGIGRYIYGWQTDFLLETQFKRLGKEKEAACRPRVQCYGHTHVPTLVKGHAVGEEKVVIEPVLVLPGHTYPLDDELALLNPGSVGQPRDTDQRAAYAILDTTARKVTFRRAAYKFRKTLRALQSGGYPDSLIRRLRDAPPLSITPNDWLAHSERARMTEVS